LKCNNIHGFISVSKSDTIENLPLNYGYNPDRPIYWYHSEKKSLMMLAPDWETMLSGKILISQEDGTGISSDVWTGSADDETGFYPWERCQGWMTKWAGQAGIIGKAKVTNGEWLNGYLSYCNIQKPIRCICTP
jgi:hypothetical protein